MSVRKQLSKSEYTKGSLFFRFLGCFDHISTAVYLLASIVLSLFSVFMVCFAIYKIYEAFIYGALSSETILESVSLIIVSIAIFDVGKYLIEEEVIREKELRSPAEARKTLTKFMVIIIIAVSLESLVYVFMAGKEDISLIIYPSALLLSITAVIIAVAFFQRMSIRTEREDKTNHNHS